MQALSHSHWVSICGAAQGHPSWRGSGAQLLSEDACFQWPEGFVPGLCHWKHEERTEILSIFIVFLPWLWYFVFRDRCPNRIWSFLFFKPSFEYFFNVIHAKRTDCGTRNAEKEEQHQGTADLFWVPTNKTQSAFWSAEGRFSPVELCGEHPYHCGNAIDLYYVCNRLQNIKVEKGISRDRTVKPSLQKRSPVLLQDALGATHVVFTYAGHTWIDSLPRGQKQGDRIMSMEGEQEQKAAR